MIGLSCLRIWRICTCPPLFYYSFETLLADFPVVDVYCSYVSPRRRAQRTLELLELGCREKLPWEERRQHADEGIRTEAKVEITDDIREWDYGDYEGITSAQIQEQRAKEGKGPWDIWRDGCPGGE